MLISRQPKDASSPPRADTPPRHNFNTKSGTPHTYADAGAFRASDTRDALRRHFGSPRASTRRLLDFGQDADRAYRLIAHWPRAMLEPRCTSSASGKAPYNIFLLAEEQI